MLMMFSTSASIAHVTGLPLPLSHSSRMQWLMFSQASCNRWVSKLKYLTPTSRDKFTVLGRGKLSNVSVVRGPLYSLSPSIRARCSTNIINKLHKPRIYHNVMLLASLHTMIVLYCVDEHVSKLQRLHTAWALVQNFLEFPLQHLRVVFLLLLHLTLRTFSRWWLLQVPLQHCD